jgi:hypothetical protein
MCLPQKPFLRYNGILELILVKEYLNEIECNFVGGKVWTASGTCRRCSLLDGHWLRTSVVKTRGYVIDERVVQACGIQD